jgi:hypothetical protein
MNVFIDPAEHRTSRQYFACQTVSTNASVHQGVFSTRYTEVCIALALLRCCYGSSVSVMC